MADANILIAAFLRDSTVRRIVTLSGVGLLVPEYAFEEMREHLPEVRARARLRSRDAEQLLRRLAGYFTVVPADLVAARLPEAEEVMADIDPRDAPYLAAALATPCDGIGSDDPHLRRQTAIRCWTTSELLGELRRAGLRF